MSYLNTVPLVWGLQAGPQQALFDLSFALPSECADRLGSNQADIGIVPSVELTRLNLNVIPGTGIACRGPVRSILLISKVPFSHIRTLAADSGSRTSVMLTRILLKQRWSAEPEIRSQSPNLAKMLEHHDAALIIGDPALLLDPATLPFAVLDLGKEWVDWTGLPMVFAVWAGPGQHDPQPFLDSLRFGQEHLDDYIAPEAQSRQIPEPLARAYLTTNIAFNLGPSDYKGLTLYRQWAEEMKEVTA